MILGVNELRLIEADYAYAKKIRFTLAHLFGLRVPSFLPELLLQGSPEEVEVVLCLMKAFAQTKTKNHRLREIAERGLQEYEIEQAFEAGRSFAMKQPMQMLQEQGLEWRYSKNPYASNGDHADEKKFDAWAQGFKTHFDIACCEQW